MRARTCHNGWPGCFLVRIAGHVVIRVREVKARTGAAHIARTARACPNGLPSFLDDQPPEVSLNCEGAESLLVARPMGHWRGRARGSQLPLGSYQWFRDGSTACSPKIARHRRLVGWSVAVRPSVRPALYACTEPLCSLVHVERSTRSVCVLRDVESSVLILVTGHSTICRSSFSSRGGRGATPRVLGRQLLPAPLPRGPPGNN